MGIWTLGIPTSVGLAAVAVIGYLVGRRQRARMARVPDVQRELRRAKSVIRQLESISQKVRRSLATHHASVQQFKDRVAVLSERGGEDAWDELSAEAEKVLRPTLALSKEIAHAYDVFRRQSNALMTFAETTVDPLTRLNNRRAMDQTLKSLFAMMARYHATFSLAILDLDDFKAIRAEQGRAHGDRLLQQFARLLEWNVRETDIASRLSGEEFVVLMPETDLAGASTLCNRIRESAEAALETTVSIGAAAALDGDTPQTLLGRADAALYGAKSEGGNGVFHHTGQRVAPARDLDSASCGAPDALSAEFPDLGELAGRAEG